MCTYKTLSSRSINGDTAAHKASALANSTLLMSPPGFPLAISANNSNNNDNNILTL